MERTERSPAGMRQAPAWRLHSLGGLGIIFANIGMILFGLAVSGMNDRWIPRLSVALGILGLVGIARAGIDGTFITPLNADNAYKAFRAVAGYYARHDSSALR